MLDEAVRQRHWSEFEAAIQQSLKRQKLWVKERGLRV
jgi:hypothetical protein